MGTQSPSIPAQPPATKLPLDKITSVSTSTPIVPRPEDTPHAASEPQAPIVESMPSQATLMAEALEKYVSVTKLTDFSHFTHQGRCVKCGWQTLQLCDNDARLLVRQHVQTHWRDVVAETTK
jgi:hypothetical protein